MNTDTIIVTRHPALVDYLREQGIEAPVIQHAKADDVRYRHAIGVLPHWLSSLCESVTEVPMRTTPEDRAAMQRGDLPIERLREIADPPASYIVRRVPEHRHDIGLALAQAARYCMAYSDLALHLTVGDWRGLTMLTLIDVTQQLSAEVLLARGLWRPGDWRWDPERGCDVERHWRDNLGREVIDVEPAFGWSPDAPESPRDDFDAWLASWWPEWQARHGRGGCASIDPDERLALREAFEAGRR